MKKQNLLKYTKKYYGLATVCIGILIEIISNGLFESQYSCFISPASEKVNYYKDISIVSWIGIGVILIGVCICLFKILKVRKITTIFLLSGLATMILSFVGFMVFVGLPYPDPTPEMLVWENNHCFISEKLAFIGGIVFIFSIVIKLILSLTNKFIFSKPQA
ncbi:MAG TPA: hypothetical protein VF941_02210 [Clostridia bacterium]